MSEPQKTTGDDQQVWDVAQYEAALSHLEKMQEQLDAVRLAIPTLMEPLLVKNSTKTKMFENVKYVANVTATDMARCRESWTSEETQNLLAKAHESKQRDGDLSKASSVPRYGWYQPPE